MRERLGKRLCEVLAEEQREMTALQRFRARIGGHLADDDGAPFQQDGSRSRRIQPLFRRLEPDLQIEFHGILPCCCANVPKRTQRPARQRLPDATPVPVQQELVEDAAPARAEAMALESRHCRTTAYGQEVTE